MNGFSYFIVNFCTSCILFGLLFALCPSGSLKPSVKYIFCLCFVCCVVGSVATIQPPDFSEFNQSANKELLTEQNVATTAQMVFGEALKQQKINFRKISVETNKSQDNSININKVTVYTDESESRILAAIGSESYEVSVVNE